LRQRLVSASAAERGFIGVGRGHSFLQDAYGPADVEEDAHADGGVAALETPDGLARDARALRDLLRGKPLQLPPRGQVPTDLAGRLLGSESQQARWRLGTAGQRRRSARSPVAALLLSRLSH